MPALPSKFSFYVAVIHYKTADMDYINNYVQSNDKYIVSCIELNKLINSIYTDVR